MKHTIFLFALFTTQILGCSFKGNILSEQAKMDAAANSAIINKMKSRTYNLGIKSVSNSISGVLSNINKSAKLLENEIGPTVSIETGFSAIRQGQDSIISNDNSENTFSNTFKYIGLNDIFWVSIKAKELSTGSTNVDLNFLLTAIGSEGKNLRPLPPKFTQSIYDKLWRAIEKDLR